MEMWGTPKSLDGRQTCREGLGKKDFFFSCLNFSVSLGGALRRDENSMAARKLVRKPAVG